MFGAGLRLLRFFFLKGNIIRVVSLREQPFQTVRRLAGNILNGATLADVGSVVRMARRGVNVPMPDELAVNDKALGLILPVPCVSYTSMWSISSFKGKRNDPQTILRFTQSRISGSFAVQLYPQDAWSFGMPI